MTKKSTPEPASEPKPEKGHKLTCDEVQHIADRAIAAWESGVPEAVYDRLGHRWEFEPVRDENSRLLIRRFVLPTFSEEPQGDPLVGQTQVGGFEFGLEASRVVITSRVQAVADPA